MVLLKFLIVACINVNIFNGISGKELIDPNTGFVLTPRVETCTQIGAVCGDDCTSILTCRGVGVEPIATAQCSDPNKPYCRSLGNGIAECTTVKNSQCTPSSTGSSGMQCTESNTILPDTTNCAQYHICYLENNESQKRSCDPGYYYDSNVGACKAGKVTCYATTCPTNVFGTTIAFKMNPQFYTLCMGNDRIVYKCGDNKIWNGSNCVLQCTSIGFFSDDENPMVFHECKKKTGNAIRHECLVDHVFDPDTSKCIMEPIVWVP